jgi:uncharacterized protein YhbP (UPF0306 family)
MMPDRSDLDRVLAANRYCVLGTADRAGTPWVTPVLFGLLDPDQVCWVSSPDSRHSQNIADRAAIAITVFDSGVPVGQAEAAYFDAEATRTAPDHVEAALRALNARLPPDKQQSAADLLPAGPMAVYQASFRRRYLLVRGGNPELRNVLDLTYEVSS